MVSPLGNAIQFLENFGFFDVLLPFLLVFTVVFGILEKTRIFGSEKDKDGMEHPKQNINSMIAFVIGLFVVVTPKLVRGIQVSLPQIAFILIALVSFMLLAGSIVSSGEFSFEKRTGWRVTLTLLLFISILAIFLNAVDWLDPVLDYIADRWKDTFIVSIVFLGIIIGTIFYVVRSPVKKEG